MKNKNEQTVQAQTSEEHHTLSMPDLWARILPWHDRLASDGAFVTRVRTALAVDGHAASEAILEYLRFAYLAWASPTGSTPSKAVDEVWHAHLLFTRSYESFCLDTRGHHLHHEPGDGETDEARFRDAYRNTLDLYRAEFGEPPGRWWPRPAPASVAAAAGSSDTLPGPVLLLPGIFLTAMAWKFLGTEVGLVSAGIVTLVALLLSASSSAPAGPARKRDRGGGSCDGGGGGIVATGPGDACSDGGGGGGDGCGGASCGSGCGGGGCGGA
ncbi:glycine-rich domain-containing protein [Methylobacterium brachiatum]